MAVPKRKTTRATRDSRRASNSATAAPARSICPQCHQPKLPHRVCPECGYYDGREIIDTE